MTEPIFWLGVSLLLVAVSLTAVLVAAVPAFRELARAARSAEKLFDTLSRELPPTLESIRLTGIEITDLTEDVSDGVQSAGRVVKQVDQSIVSVAHQAKRAQSTTRTIWTGVKAAWRTFNQSPSKRRMPERFSNKIKRSSTLNQSQERYEAWQELEQYASQQDMSRYVELDQQTYETTHYSETRHISELDEARESQEEDSALPKTGRDADC